MANLLFRPAEALAAEGADAARVRDGPGEALGTALGLRMQVGARHEGVGEGARHRPSTAPALVLLREGNLVQ